MPAPPPVFLVQSRPVWRQSTTVFNFSYKLNNNCHRTQNQLRCRKCVRKCRAYSLGFATHSCLQLYLVIAVRWAYVEQPTTTKYIKITIDKQPPMVANGRWLAVLWRISRIRSTLRLLSVDFLRSTVANKALGCSRSLETFAEWDKSTLIYGFGLYWFTSRPHARQPPTVFLKVLFAHWRVIYHKKWDTQANSISENSGVMLQVRKYYDL